MKKLKIIAFLLFPVTVMAHEPSARDTVTKALDSVILISYLNQNIAYAVSQA